MGIWFAIKHFLFETEPFIGTKMKSHYFKLLQILFLWEYLSFTAVVHVGEPRISRAYTFLYKETKWLLYTPSEGCCLSVWVNPYSLLWCCLFWCVSAIASNRIIRAKLLLLSFLRIIRALFWWNKTEPNKWNKQKDHQKKMYLLLSRANVTRHKIHWLIKIDHNLISFLIRSLNGDHVITMRVKKKNAIFMVSSFSWMMGCFPSSFTPLHLLYQCCHFVNLLIRCRFKFSFFLDERNLMWKINPCQRNCIT